MNNKDFTSADYVFENHGRWFFFDKDGSAVGPYQTEDVAVQKWLDYQLYLHAH